jgi:hypothetical protein
VKTKAKVKMLNAKISHGSTETEQIKSGPLCGLSRPTVRATVSAISRQSSSTRREPFERFGISPIPPILTGLITRPAPRAAGIDGSALIYSTEGKEGNEDGSKGLLVAFVSCCSFQGGCHA